MILNMEFESSHIQIKYINEGEEEKTVSMEFVYQLMDSIVPTNVFSAKFSEIDQLDTHDPFFNYMGYRYKITGDSKIEY